MALDGTKSVPPALMAADCSAFARESFLAEHLPYFSQVSDDVLILREGDLILTINELPVASVDDLHRFLAEWPIGRQVMLELLRGQEQLTMQITPGEAI